MILTSRQIVWTPIIGQDSLAIALDRTFAEVCLAHTPEDVTFFVKAVWRFMGNKLPVTPSNFLDIYNGILPKGFYAGGNGLWLTLDTNTVGNTKRPLMYHGHNEESAADRIWLLKAFQAWATAAVTVLNWE